MKRPKFINCWRVFTVISFLLICVHLYLLSKETFHRVVTPEKDFEAFLEIDLCYKTNIEGHFCNTSDTPDVKTLKQPFFCDFQDPVECYTRDFQSKTASEIIREFKRCNNSIWPTVEIKTKKVRNIETEHLLFGGFICLRRRFAIENKNENSHYVIRSKNFHKFNAYISYSRNYKLEGEYRSKKALLFSRDCWKTTDERSKCTETDKKLVFEIEYYSSKFLEYPFITDCVYRKKANQSIRQNDCYEDCIKVERKFHLLTYGEDDYFTLDYANASDLRSLLDRCAASCKQEDCQITGLFLTSHNGNSHKGNSFESVSNGSFIVDLVKNDGRTEEIPLFETVKVLWMISALISTFFGLNFYGLLTRLTNLHHSRHFPRKQSRIRKKAWNKKRSSIFFLIIIATASLGLVLENVWFDLGRETALIVVMNESISDRNVSVSLCFDLCKILKDGPNYEKDCEDHLYEKSIKELNEITWGVKEFKSRVSMRNSARVYPIRQDDFKVPVFFRGFKKCFLLYYESKNQWPHLPMQQASFVYIKISGQPRYAHFFIEDGYKFPQIYAKPTEKSVLHSIWQGKKRSRDGCINYEPLRTRDDFIQECVVRNQSQDKIVLTSVNLKIEGNLSEYADCKFSNKSASDILEYCSINKTNECTQIKTGLNWRTLDQEEDEISVNLTPTIYEERPLEDESTLVVLNRIISFLIIFTGFSVREFSEAIISFYFLNVLSSSRLTRRLFYLCLSLLFLIHFCFLFNQIIHQPMLVNSYFSQANEVWSYVFRLCYRMGFDFDSHHFTVDKLQIETLSLSDIFEKVKFYNELDEVIELDFQNFTFKNFLFECCDNDVIVQVNEMYFEDMKCFNFYFPSKERDRLNFRSLRLNKLISISFSFREFTKKQFIKKNLIFLNREWVYSFAWNRTYRPADYVFETNTFVNSYSDDYWYIKNLALYLKDLVGWSKSINSIRLYLKDIRDAFIAEQYASTTLVPIDLDNTTDLVLKNRQFNYYMQFRAMATSRNDYDFTKNTEKVTLTQTCYVQKESEDQKELTLTVGSNLIKFVEKSRNRYRVVELFLHLFISASFWFGVNVISLPISLKSAYPVFKMFVFYFFYYVVSFFVYLFEFWFAFVRFLKFKSD